MDVEDLVQELRRGNPAAGAFLVSLCAPELLGYARAVASDLSDADREQICERAVEGALRRIEAFDPRRGTFRAWLRGFVRHEAGNWRRSYGALDELDGNAHLGPAPLAREVTPADRAVLAELVRSLSPTDQAILALRDIERLSYAAIAARLDRSEAACRQRHRRAAQRLADLAHADGRLDHWRQP